MRRAFVVLLSTLGLIGGLIATAAPAGAATPRTYYLSLGDSLAFGYQPNLVPADSTPADYNSYAEYYADLHPGLTLVNYGCSGETTTTMISGGCPQLAQYGPDSLHNAYTGAQLVAAEGFLAAHGSHTALITVDIGSDDLLQVIEPCEASPDPLACAQGSLQTALGTLTANYEKIVRTLRSYAPHARIALFNFYNPLAVAIPATDQLTAMANDVVDQVAASVSASVVDAFGAINYRAGSPLESVLVCALTWECTSYQDVHPNTLGYLALTFALARDVRS